MEFNRIKIEPLSATIGAEVQGVDLTKLDDATFDQIHEAFLRHQVLFFRDQELTREQHLSFGRRFGELHIHSAAPSPEGYPAIMRIHADAASTANLDQLKAGKRAVAGNFLALRRIVRPRTATRECPLPSRRPRGRRRHIVFEHVRSLRGTVAANETPIARKAFDRNLLGLSSFY